MIQAGTRVKTAVRFSAHSKHPETGETVNLMDSFRPVKRGTPGTVLSTRTRGGLGGGEFAIVKLDGLDTPQEIRVAPEWLAEVH
jgi:hypothetical protein